jgi:hypothetical protein
MATIYRYFLVLAACAAVLLGIQIPNFVDQYEKRLDAHLSEVAINLRAYQEIADQFFGGSVQALIDKHQQGKDAVFKAEAKPIGVMLERYRRFNHEKRALDTGLPRKIAAIATAGDRQLIDETLASYSFTVPLNGAAVACGFVVMAVIVLLMELLRVAVLKLLHMRSYTSQVTH